MTVKERVLEKEKSIRALLELLRNNLNNQRILFDKDPQSWNYITALSFTENNLKEIIKYFETNPN